MYFKVAKAMQPNTCTVYEKLYILFVWKKATFGPREVSTIIIPLSQPTVKVISFSYEGFFCLFACLLFALMEKCQLVVRRTFFFFRYVFFVG